MTNPIRSFLDCASYRNPAWSLLHKLTCWLYWCLQEPFLQARSKVFHYKFLAVVGSSVAKESGTRRFVRTFCMPAYQQLVSLPLQLLTVEFSSDKFRTACLEIIHMRKKSSAYSSNVKGGLCNVTKKVSSGLIFILRWFIPALFQILS
jgi:hypothetical protein